MDTRIYVMTHKSYTKPSDEEYDGLYHTLHVGCAISEDLGYHGDDVGDNISDRNKNWCELTGMYWIWKNVSCDIVGICHYRRYFVENETLLRKEKIESVLSEYQVIVSYSGFTEYGSLKEQYSSGHHWKDMDTVKQVLLEKYPEYEAAFDLCMSCNLFTVGNMMIVSKRIYDEYCEWLFDILFETEKRIDISAYDAFQARVMGYLSERLLRVWLLFNAYKVKEIEVRMLDPAESDAQIRAVGLKQRAVSLILKDLIINYHNGNYIDLVDSFQIYHGFDGKIPVWVCWWQGREEMPELVSMCIDSIDANIPRDICEMRLITWDNVSEYVSFPQWIVDKYNKGIITMTAMSDILRMNLLYRYGGMWIDATYYVSSPMDRSVFDLDFYTLRFKKAIRKDDISTGRWLTNLLYGKVGNPLFRFSFNALYLYWFTRDELIDYCLLDYIIETAYSNIDEVKRMIDICPYSEPTVFELDKYLDEVYDESEYARMKDITTFYKLNIGQAHSREVITGKPTFYGHMCGKAY